MEKLAPALYNHFSRSFTSDQLQTISSLFGLVVEQQGLEDPRIIRPEGASFNPRPARICQIIIAEYGASDSENSIPRSDRAKPSYLLFLAALLSQLSRQQRDLLPELANVPSSVWITASEASKLIKSEVAAADNHDSEIIYLSDRLDWLRHLHMSNLDLKQQAKFIQDLDNVVVPSIRFESNNRYRELLNAGIARWQLKHN